MKISHIELLGKKYPLCFSLAASERISEEFGSIENMQKSLKSEDFATAARTVDAVLSALMDAGQIYCKMAQIDCPPPLECRPADLIDISDPTAIQAIFEAMTAGNEREVEVVSKNVKAPGKK